MSRIAQLLFLLYLSSCANAFAANILITEINKSSNGQWQVSYRSKTPVSSIQLVNTPDDSRNTRWRLISEGFELKQFAGKDTVLRRDGQTFDKVSFALTPTYTHLPKNYAPFAPFSDESMLLHSGRFFACAELCSGLENLWYLKLTAPQDDLILLNGIQAYGQVSWYDKNDGIKVYVGQLRPTNFNDLLAILDPALPDDIRQPLDRFLPLAIDFLSKQFNPLPQKPMLFASFGKTDDGRYGRQGGVLPNQIFMHWYGKVHKTDSYDLLWFFAHEAAHIFQDIGGVSIEDKDAWIHEGHAEYIAGQLLVSFYPDAKGYVHARKQTAKSRCRNILSNVPLAEFSNNGEFSELYSCGLHFFNLMAKASQTPDTFAFEFWRALAQLDKGTLINEALIKSKMSLFINSEAVEEINSEMGW